MSREFFAGLAGDASAHVLARRRWSIWPVSITTHVVALGALFVSPLMGPPLLPIVPTSPQAFVASMDPPQAPASPQRGRVRELPDSLRPSNVAPLVAPDRIGDETGIEPLEPMAFSSDAEPGAVPLLHADLAMTEPAPSPLPDAPLPVGGRISPPRKLRHVNPIYPSIAIAGRIEGIVVIQATIGRNGHVEDAEVLRSVTLLDDAALDAVRQWTFTPTLLNGVPVRVLMTVTVQFMLKHEV